MLLTLPPSAVVSILIKFVKIIGKSGYVIYYGYKLTGSGFRNIKSPLSLNLIDRCSMLAQMLQSAEESVLISPMGRNLVQKLVNAMVWSKFYDEKSSISKLFFSSSYSMIFDNYHAAITRDLSDLSSCFNLAKNKKIIPRKVSKTIDNIAKNTIHNEPECHCELRKTNSCPDLGLKHLHHRYTRKSSPNIG